MEMGEQVDQPEIYGSPRRVWSTVVSVLVILVIGGILLTMHGDRVTAVTCTLVAVAGGLLTMSRLVVCVEIKGDQVRVDTYLTSFTALLSEIKDVREHLSWTDIKFRGRFGPYSINRSQFSRQEFQDLIRKLRDYA